MLNPKIISSVIMIIIILFLVYFLTKKYKLTKKQIIIFWILVLFWSSVSIIRAYRKAYAIDLVEIGGLGLDIAIATQITAAYGLISFILRLPLFFISDLLDRKRIFIQLGMIFMMIASILVYFKPGYTTLYISSMSMGACASMLAIFNVIFSETFSKEQAAVSTSILATAPLLAEFIAAPIQYIGTSGDIKNYSLLWLLSTIIAFITLILTSFITDIEHKKIPFSITKVKNVLNNKAFIYICVIAFMQSFVKFATSGPNMIVYNKGIGMQPLLLAYNDVMFAAPQLIASILVGTYLIKKYNIERILQIGIISTIIFYILVILNNNPKIVFLSYIFNGFGYGLIYTSIISIALQYFDKEYRNISMGIFQAFFSAGIYFGDSIHKSIYTYLPNGLLNIESNKTIFIIAIITSTITISLCQISIFLKRTK
ncbi:MFS transporter [Streptobacillus felis]|uniref:MFS transporter n=1 Tax=Streptobacillus felis TaxID=1384509 RepID=A0A7Z0PFY1_9FUSO|nr:MFS transporter [Streptobacillus felis]NYV27525.1 MFS transporter [Streptobacillus felis]